MMRSIIASNKLINRIHFCRSFFSQHKQVKQEENLECKDKTGQLNEASLRNVKRALYGNMAILGAKAGTWAMTGSQAMLSEAIHTAIDCGNQLFLLMGIRLTERPADDVHPWGYGKGAFFYSVVSAVGMFWVGGVATSAMGVMHMVGGESDIQHGWTGYGVLGMSFVIDGWVLWGALRDLRAQKPKGESTLHFLR